ncbi:MAG: ATP-binding cassette domain-containing protein, partial [Verrucomicrobiota bacterium]
RHSVREVYEEFVASNLARNGEESEKLRPQWESAFVLQSELTLDSIRFRYPEAKNEVLRGVSAVIQRNEAVALVGETGAGKSTLVDLVLGLHRPSAGRILLDGKGLTQEEAPRWQSAIGYVPQEVFLFDDTISRNIAIGVPESEIDPARLLEVAEIAQIRRFIEEETGEGFSTRVGDRGVKLSGGQRQRLGLARALYHCPQVLVLDEATSALDGATENAVIAAIERLRHSLMIIVVAHRLSTIRHCDRVLRLEGGVLSECPDPRRACA